MPSYMHAMPPVTVRQKSAPPPLLSLWNCFVPRYDSVSIQAGAASARERGEQAPSASLPPSLRCVAFPSFYPPLKMKQGQRAREWGRERIWLWGVREGEGVMGIFLLSTSRYFSESFLVNM